MLIVYIKSDEPPVLRILVDKPPVFGFVCLFGPTLMTRDCIGALRLAAARPMKFVYCDMKLVATLLRTSATPRRAVHRRHREPMTMGRNEL